MIRQNYYLLFDSNFLHIKENMKFGKYQVDCSVEWTNHISHVLRLCKDGKTVITQKCYNSLKEFPFIHTGIEGINLIWNCFLNICILNVGFYVLCSRGIVFNNLVDKLHSFTMLLKNGEFLRRKKLYEESSTICLYAIDLLVYEVRSVHFC